jgi:hypothetical protein
MMVRPAKIVKERIKIHFFIFNKDLFDIQIFGLQRYIKLHLRQHIDKMQRISQAKKKPADCLTALTLF